MTGKTHIAIGITAGLIISMDKPIETQFLLVLSTVIGSLTPDLDHPKSKLNQKLLIFKNKLYSTLFYLILSFIFACLYIPTENIIFKLLAITCLFIGISTHRGFTHSLLGLFLFSYIIKSITIKYNLYPIYSGFIIGYTLHLVADFFTTKGIKLFFPLNINIASPLVLNSNKIYEKFLFNILCIVCIYLLIM